MQFTARVITGSGRGKGLGTPTLNLDLQDVPADLAEGIYAGRVEWRVKNEELRVGMTESIRNSSFVIRNCAAAIHYGPRPVFNDSLSFEVHLLDADVPSAPPSVMVTVLERIRDVRNFPSPEELKTEIARDIERCRAILGKHAPDTQEHPRP